jgi:hypothetical protein
VLEARCARDELRGKAAGLLLAGCQRGAPGAPGAPGSVPVRLLSRSTTAPSCDASPPRLNPRCRPAAAGKASQASAGSPPSCATRVRTACATHSRSQRAASRSCRMSWMSSSSLATACSTSGGRSSSVGAASAPGLLRAAIYQSARGDRSLCFCRCGSLLAGDRGGVRAPRLVGLEQLEGTELGASCERASCARWDHLYAPFVPVPGRAGCERACITTAAAPHPAAAPPPAQALRHAPRQLIRPPSPGSLHGS